MKLNKIMKSFAALLAIGCSGFAFAGGDGWSSDFEASKKLAAESKADLLVDFTGSDWCGWCIRLNKEVFSHDPFKEGVKGKFVLVEIDKPKDTSKLSAETLKQNMELVKKYEIKGYPTILLCDAGGKPYAKTGYQEGGPEAYVKSLDELRGQKGKRDAAFASAAKTEGVEKAKLLISALDAMTLTDGQIANFYGDISEQIKAADPKDETGFGKRSATKARLAKFEADLGGFAQKKDMDGALGVVNAALKEGGFEVQETQKMIMTKAMIYAQQKKFDEAIVALDEAKATAPGSKMNTGIDGMKKRLLEEKEKASAPKEDKTPAAE
jgi:thioredoxin-related protein